MHTQLNELLEKYSITQMKIAETAKVSRPLVCLVLKGERADKRGIISTALDLVEEAKQREEENRQRLNALLHCEAAA